MSISGPGHTGIMELLVAVAAVIAAAACAEEV